MGMRLRWSHLELPYGLKLPRVGEFIFFLLWNESLTQNTLKDMVLIYHWGHRIVEERRERTCFLEHSGTHLCEGKS